MLISRSGGAATRQPALPKMVRGLGKVNDGGDRDKFFVSVRASSLFGNNIVHKGRLAKPC